MVYLDFENQFDRTIKKIEEVGKLYAEARGQSYQAQELKGSVLSSIIKSQGEMPISKAEILAKSSDDYTTYVKETAQAITKELRLKAEYEAWKSRFEATRSLCSLQKSTDKEIQ